MRYVAASQELAMRIAAIRFQSDGSYDYTLDGDYRPWKQRQHIIWLTSRIGRVFTFYRDLFY